MAFRFLLYWFMQGAKNLKHMLIKLKSKAKASKGVGDKKVNSYVGVSIRYSPLTIIIILTQYE